MRRKQSNSHLDNRQVVMLENAFYQVRSRVPSMVVCCDLVKRADGVSAIRQNASSGKS